MLQESFPLFCGGEKEGVLLIGVDDLDVVDFFSGKVGSSQFGGTQEFVERCLLSDTAHLDP